MNLLLTHGSPSPEHDESAARLARAVGERLGDHVEVAGLGEALPDRSRVMPLFLSEGKHLLNDVPAMLAAGHAELVAGPASYPEAMAGMLAGHAAAQRDRRRPVLFALYRLLGSSALATALYRESKRFPLPAVAGLHGESRFEDVLDLWQQEGQKDAFVQPALLFPGASLRELTERASEREMAVKIGEPLAELPEFAEWIAARFREGS